MRARISSGILFTGERVTWRSENHVGNFDKILRCLLQGPERATAVSLSSSTSRFRAYRTFIRLVVSRFWTWVGTRFVWIKPLDAWLYATLKTAFRKSTYWNDKSWRLALIFCFEFLEAANLYIKNCHWSHTFPWNLYCATWRPRSADPIRISHHMPKIIELVEV